MQRFTEYIIIIYAIIIIAGEPILYVGTNSDFKKQGDMPACRGDGGPPAFCFKEAK
jgi:hypothetical protein